MWRVDKDVLVDADDVRFEHTDPRSGYLERIEIGTPRNIEWITGTKRLRLRGPMDHQPIPFSCGIHTKIRWHLAGIAKIHDPLKAIAIP